ncbi:hypothetical protein FOZ62_003185, partial [Perkinsus olseni]
RFEQVKREQDRVGGYKEAVKIANDHATAAMGEGDGSGGSAAAAERYYQKESNAGGTAADFGYANRRDSAQEDSAVATVASLSTVAVRAKPETKNHGNGSSSSAIPKLAAPGTLPKLPPPPSRRQHHDVAQGPSIITTTQQQQQQQGSMDLLGFDDDDEEEKQPPRITEDRTVNFMLYFVDKKKAQYDRWRISEPTLLGFGIIAPFGGLMGMFIMRHKTKHWYFWLNNVFFAILWIIMGIALVSSYGWCSSSSSMVPCIVTACLIAVGGLAAVYC